MENKIKVLHVVIQMDLGGYENYIMNIYRNIDRSKFQFDFLCMKQGEGFFEKEIKELGGKVHHLSFGNDFRYFKMRKELINILKENQYDIVHFHNRHYSPFALPIIKKYVKNIIIHSHNSNKEKTLKGLLVWILGKYPANKGYHQLACSREAGDSIFKKGSYDLMPNCIDTKKYAYDEKTRIQLRKEYDISEDAFVIGHIGRFAPVKNHPFILKIFRKYLENSNGYLCLCGKGADKEKVLKQIQSDSVLSKRVVILESGDVSKYYSIFDCFSLPSFSEGYPLSLLESQAAGCPSLASDTITREAELTDIIKYLPINDENIWVEEINKIKAATIDRKKYNKAIVNSSYDSKKATEILANYYLRIIAE